MRLPIRTILTALMLGFAFSASAAENHWVKVDGGTWIPDAKTVSRIKGQIEPFVRARAESEGRRIGEWRAYTFQYQGYEENGKKLIFVNAFCSGGEPRQLNKQLIIVNDAAGTCSFNLSYEVDKDMLTGLLINGDSKENGGRQAVAVTLKTDD